jgi:hypothetical protein
MANVGTSNHTFQQEKVTFTHGGNVSVGSEETTMPFPSNQATVMCVSREESAAEKDRI